jgi:hypothetical protein
LWSGSSRPILGTIEDFASADRIHYQNKEHYVRIRLLALLSVAALAGAGAFAAISSGDSGSSPVASSVTEPMNNAVRHADVTRVNRANVPQAAQRAPAAFNLLKYYVSSTRTLGGGRASVVTTLTCPQANQGIVSGFFTTDRFVVPDVSFASTTRKWQFGFDNLLNTTGHYRMGIVCAS